MRHLGLGLLAVGAIALGLGLASGPAGAPMRQVGLLCLCVAVGVLLGELGLRALGRRVRLQAGEVRALRGALQHGQDLAQQAIARLREHGLDGAAQILQLAPTGGRFNQRAEVDLELEITVTGRAPYRLRQRHLVPEARLERLRAGQSLPVKVDPQVEERLLIDWAT